MKVLVMKKFEITNAAERRETVNAVHNMPEFAAYAVQYGAGYMVKGVSVC